MAKMIQIRNVSDEVHRQIKARAARAGMSLSDYLYREVRMLASTPDVDEVLDRIASRGRVKPGEPPGQVVREERRAG